MVSFVPTGPVRLEKGRRSPFSLSPSLGKAAVNRREREMGFQQVDLGNGVVVAIEVNDVDMSVSSTDDGHSFGEDGRGLDKLKELVDGAAIIASTFSQRLTPDDVTLEISVGFSAEVGWFFAKSEIEAVVKLSLAWKKPSKA